MRVSGSDMVAKEEKEREERWEVTETSPRYSSEVTFQWDVDGL